MIRLAALVQPEYRTVSRFWAIRPDGAASFATSHLDVRCVPRVPTGEGVEGVERVTCAAYDGSRTGIYALDAASHKTMALASMPGRFFLHGEAGGSWMTGWWDRATVLIEPTARAVLRVEANDRQSPNFLAAADAMVAALWSNGDQSTVRLYSFD